MTAGPSCGLALPPWGPTARSTSATLKQKYAEERAKRLRPDGNDQYLQLKGQLAHYLDDPYRRSSGGSEDRPRHGGLHRRRLRRPRHRRSVEEAGVDDVRIIEKGGDFGAPGTGTATRRGATASFVYMPLLEETGHMPTEKYAHAPEILEHCQRIGKQFGLYEHALFHTEVTDLGGTPRRHGGSCAPPGRRVHRPVPRHGHGSAARPQAPGHPGNRVVRRPLLPHQPMGLRLHGRRQRRRPDGQAGRQASAIVGTGATAVQCIPHLAQACGELYVFQRTPSSVDVRDNRPTDPDWFAEIATPGGSSGGWRTSPPTRPE